MNKKRLFAVGTAAVAALCILPRLLQNFGCDSSSYVAAMAAERFFSSGIYLPASLPGNPLFEYVLALIVPWGGHIAANGLSAAAYVLSVWFFFRIAAPRRNAWAVTVLLSLTPLILVFAGTTKDNIPALALILAAYHALTFERYTTAAMLIGCAAGFRLDHLVLVIPLAAYLRARGKPWIKSVFLVLLAVTVGLAGYLPVYLSFGPGSFARSVFAFDFSPLRTAYYGLMVWGPIAVICLAAIAVTNRDTLGQGMEDLWEKKDPAFVFEFLAVLLYAFLFLMHADESARLIPVIPFVYLLMARFLSKRHLAAACICIFSFAFVNLELKGGDSGRPMIQPRFAAGAIVHDYLFRGELNMLRNGLGIYDWPEKSFVLTGMGSILTHNNALLNACDISDVLPCVVREKEWGVPVVYRLKDHNDVYFFYCLSRDNVLKLEENGYTVFMFSEYAPGDIINRYKYDPEDAGIRKLDIYNDRAFYKL